MKTLLVHFLPNTRSLTRRLVDAFREAIGDAELEELDLCQDVPDLLSPAAIAAYYARLDGETPRDVPVAALANMDRMTAQLKSSDIVVVAFPMYNFSMPATVKAWFDSVMLQGDTFERHPRGGYRGLLTDKKGLAIVAASGTYSTGTDGSFGMFGPDWEHAVSLAKTEFRFMGFADIRGVLAESTARPGEVRESSLSRGVAEIRAIVEEWYGGAVERTTPADVAAVG